MIVIVSVWEVLEEREHLHEENWRRQGEYLLNHPELTEKVRFSIYLHREEETEAGRRMLIMGFKSREGLESHNRRLVRDEEFKRLYEEWKSLIAPSTRRVEFWEPHMEDLWIS